MLPVYLTTLGVNVTTAKWLRDGKVPFIVVTHSAKNVKEFEKNFGGKADDYLVTNKTGLLSSRDAVLRTAGDWYVGLDDDLHTVTAVPYRVAKSNDALPTISEKTAPDGGTWRQLYGRKIDAAEFMRRAADVVAKCEDETTPLGGFATLDNPYFRSRRWSHVRCVSTCAYVYHAPTGPKTMKYEYCHDQYLSLDAIARFGKVCVDNFVYAGQTPFANIRGVGLGSYDERAAKTEPQIDALVKEFDGLITKSSAVGTKFPAHSLGFVRNWRAAKGFL